MTIDSAVLILLAIAGMALFMIIFNIVHAVKRNIKRIKIINGILLGIIGLIVAGQIADTVITDRDYFSYDIDTSALLGSYNYTGHADGYYLVSQSTFLGSGGNYAIPEENISLPLLTRIYSPVTLYSNKGTDLDDGQEIDIDGWHYIVADNVVKIRPQYFDLFLVTGILDIFILVLYNIIELIVYIVWKHKAKRQVPM